MTLGSEHSLTHAVGIVTVAPGGEHDMTDINTLISERFGRKTDVGRGRDVEMLNKILEHRSIRKYQNKEVSEDLIEII